jgi:hypothetical protein
LKFLRTFGEAPIQLGSFEMSADMASLVPGNDPTTIATIITSAVNPPVAIIAGNARRAILSSPCPNNTQRNPQPPCTASARPARTEKSGAHSKPARDRSNQSAKERPAPSAEHCVAAKPPQARVQPMSRPDLLSAGKHTSDMDASWVRCSIQSSLVRLSGDIWCPRFAAVFWPLAWGNSARQLSQTAFDERSLLCLPPGVHFRDPG